MANPQRGRSRSHLVSSTLTAFAAYALLWPLGSTAATVITLPAPNLYLPAGVADASVSLKVHVEGIGADMAPTVMDLPPSAAAVPSITVEANPTGLSVKPAGYDWTFQLTIGKIPPKLTQKRPLKITAAGKTEITQIVLNNQGFVWTLKSATPSWPVRGDTGRMFQAGIVQGPASRARITYCRLDGPVPFDCKNLQLCADGPGNCSTEANLEDMRPRSLSLQLSQEFHEPGIYKGSVDLTADDSPDPQMIPLELSYTSDLWQLLGVLMIALGVFLGWLLTVYARSRVSRDRALVAVADFDETAEGLHKKLGTLPKALAGNAAKTKAALADLRLSFTPRKLDGKGYLPTPFGPGDQTAYQAFLTATAPHVAMLKVIVDGMLTAVALPEHPKPGDLTPHARVLAALDLLDASISPPSPQAAQTQVQAQLNSLLPPGILPAALPANAPPPTAESLRLDIERINWAAWLAWLVITIVVGYLAEVDKPGFGTWTDLIVCLLWGFGVPAAGTQLSQLTPTSVATTLKIPTV